MLRIQLLLELVSTVYYMIDCPRHAIHVPARDRRQWSVNYWSVIYSLRFEPVCIGCSLESSAGHENTIVWTIVIGNVPGEEGRDITDDA